MKIHLKRNQKLFINGAVIRLDRRGSIELMNDAQFLMENHILQQEDAKTPLQQVYFIVQTMLMDPANSHLTKYLLDSYSDVLLRFDFSKEYNELIGPLKRWSRTPITMALSKCCGSRFIWTNLIPRSCPSFLSTNKMRLHNECSGSRVDLWIDRHDTKDSRAAGWS